MECFVSFPEIFQTSAWFRFKVIGAISNAVIESADGTVEAISIERATQIAVAYYALFTVN